MHRTNFSPRRYWVCGVLGLVLCVFLCGTSASLFAQKAENERKVLRKVAAKYPEDLRKHEIGGIVRLSIVISPNGNVEKVTPVGGNPILVDAATLAVKQWKYAAADASTTTEVQFDFTPH
jgi:TonB family protein